MIRKLFVIIQPLQYLQALELFNESEERLLIVLCANERSQLLNLVKTSDWYKIYWVEYSGSVADIIFNRKKIKLMLNEICDIDEIVISSYYNEFMNLIVNTYRKANVVLLEDGNATIEIESSRHYKSYKYYIKYCACKFFSFNISPITNVTLMLLDRPAQFDIPLIAKNVIKNSFQKLRSELKGVTKEENSNEIYFISSAFINAGMMSKENYLLFLSRLSVLYKDVKLVIILHRFDKREDFLELDNKNNISVVESVGPVELYFRSKKILPELVLTAGSGATETIKLIYGIDVKVYMPKVCYFQKAHKSSIELLVKHLRKKYTVDYL